MAAFGEVNNESESKSAFKDIYNARLLEFYESHKDSSHNVKKPWTSKRVLEVIDQIKKSRVTMRRDSSDYYWILKYDVMETSDKDFLIFKKKTADDPTVRIVALEEYFDILTEVHKAVGHGGREKIIYNIKDKLHIPKKAIEIFIKLCGVCEMKRSMPKKGIVTKPLISPDFNSRGQVDLVDYQSAPDGAYKWLMNYQDHATKFLHLRPLKSKRAVEVAFELLKIFLEFGAPLILQSDNGKEFTASVITELVQLWPECKIIHGSPRRPQTQGSVERSNQDIENMLRCWMTDNHSTNWSVGCYFVQYYKNSSFHRIIGRSPYRALFGSDPKTLLEGTNIPKSVTSSIQTEMENSADVKLPEGTTVQYALSSEVPSTSVVDIMEVEDFEMATAEMIVSETFSVLDSANTNVVTATIDQDSNGIQILALHNDNTTVSIQGLPTNNNMADMAVKEDANQNKKNIDTATGSSANAQICLVCKKETTGAHSCMSCSKPVHAICGFSDSEEGYGAQILYFICRREHDIFNERDLTLRGTKRAAEKMIDQTVKNLPQLEIGHSVLIKVPKFDRGPLDTKNITGKVVDIRNGVIKIGTTSGTIKNWFPRQELQISAKEYTGEISETLITLRHAVTCQSMFGGQGFQKCYCKPAKNQCRTKRCACFKNAVLCSSKCHSSLSCVNK